MQKNVKKYKEALKHLKDWQTNPMSRRAHVYEKDIPDHEVEKMLDLDKPFKQQSKHVRDILKSKGIHPKKSRSTDDVSNDFGMDIYNNITRKHFSRGMGTTEAKKAASKELLSWGIPGNKFLDQMSRDSKGKLSKMHGKIRPLPKNSKMHDWIDKGIENKKGKFLSGETRPIAETHKYVGYVNIHGSGELRRITGSTKETVQQKADALIQSTMPTRNFVEFTAKGKEDAIKKINEQPVEEVFANTPALGKLSSMFGK
jgi:hypothetical protein